jgi:hypothetical protein
MNHLSRIAILGVALTTLLASACADDDSKSNDLLQYIPADTPYVLALTEPFPDELMDRFESVADKTLASYRTIIDYYMEEAAAEAKTQEDGEAEAARLLALRDEVNALMSVQGLRDAGIGRDSLFAIYGDGILPVIRLSLTDNEAFEAAIARIEARVDARFLVGELDGLSYRYHDQDKFRLVVAIPGKDAVIAILPATVSDERLATTLGLKKPSSSLAKSGRLQKISKEYGFTEHFAGLIDVERVAASLLDDPQGRNAELFEAVGFDTSMISSTCRNEIRELAAIAPRVAFGYTEVSSKVLGGSMIVELRDDIATGLATLPAAVPGLGLDMGGLFSLGFSLDPLAARNFYEARLDALEADPFECEHMADLQAGTAKGREALAKPLPPVVYGFRGFLANVTGIEGMDIATNKPPESIDASLLLVMENAQDLVTMAAMMSPEVAALNLLPDGKAKPLNLPQLAAVAEQAFAALTENGLAVALGEGADANAESMLEADLQSPAPLMSMSMDAKKYYELVAEAAMQEEDHDHDGDEAPMPPAVRAAVQDIMVSSADLYERVSVNVLLTRRGIEIDSRVTLAE